MSRTTTTLATLCLVPLLAACDAGQVEDDVDLEEVEQPDNVTVESPALTPEVAGPGVRLATDSAPGLGRYITDGDGRALYMFTADTAGTSTCFDRCAEAWPPFMAGSAEPIAGDGLQADLVDRTARQAAGLQVTYGGFPLDYYQQDQGPGQTTGQDVHGFGGEWYLVTPGGEPLHAEDGR